MRTPGRGFFGAGATSYVVVGLVHVARQLQGRPAEAEPAHEAMLAFSVTALGMTWSLADAYDALSSSFASLSITVGALDLYVLRALRPTGAALAGLAVVSGLGALALAAITGFGRVAPPFYLYALTTTLFVVAAVRSRARA